MSARSTLILATLAACLAFASPASATPAVPTSVFDPAEAGWLSYRNLTSSQFADKFAALKDDHMVIDLEVDVIDDSYRVGAVFRQNPDGRLWASHRNLSSDEFHAKWEHYRDRDFRLVDQETWVRDGRREYAGVWIENREGFGWASYRNVTSASFSEKFDHYRDRGYLPIDVEVYPVGDGYRYGAIWVENRESLDWRLRRGLTSGEYGDAFDAYADIGLRSLDVEAVETDDGRRYAGVWIENRSGRASAQRRDLTVTGFRNRWNRYADQGFRLDGYEKYDTDDGPRYAGIWRQNGDRWDWPLRAEVDEKIDDELDTYGPPGISVAVAHQGELVYVGGRGYQDIEDGVWMHGSSVGRLASVSKAVAGTLAMRMLDKHPSLLLSDPVRSPHLLPELPAHHTYTVGDTVSNRSCVDHYPDGFSGSNQTHYDTAMEVVEDFMDQDLVCDPPSYKYSTHAYTVFAAVLERLEGKSADRIALDELSTPFGLKTLRTENLATELPDLATQYRTATKEHTGDDTSNKWYGGGFVSSARDLTRFGARILDGTILTEDQRTTMWTSPGTVDYAYGWNIGAADSGERMFFRLGSQPGGKAYLRIYPDDGIVVSVLMNSDGGEWSSGRLSSEIGELMLDEL
jgi:CubicO group peptidase (beta-lactamase class C family)